MNRLPQWVKLPTAWIESKQLTEFKWGRGEGANNLAALMSLTVISHRADPESGVARLTYDEICDMTMLSRAKVSAGIKVLERHSLIVRTPDRRSSYGLAGYN